MNKPPRNLLKLEEQIYTAHHTLSSPLAVDVTDVLGQHFSDIAINDIALTHTNPQQAIDLAITMNGKSLTRRMRGDGFIVATHLGALGYNASAGGVLPLTFDDNIMLATPLCAMRIFDGYIPPFATASARFKIRSLSPEHRLVTVVADNRVVCTSAASTKIWRDPRNLLRLLHNAQKPLEDKYYEELRNVERRIRGSTPPISLK
jgi:NAD kinase